MDGSLGGKTGQSLLSDTGVSTGDDAISKNTAQGENEYTNALCKKQQDDEIEEKTGEVKQMLDWMYITHAFFPINLFAAL